MKPITKRTADRHEALVLRLEALLRPVEAIALRRPTAPVPDALALAAESLLFDARRFTHETGLPASAPAYAALAVQLGAARARLEAFELRYTLWDAKLQCIVWRTDAGQLPLRRVHPRPVAPPVPEPPAEDILALRRLIARQLAEIEANLAEPAEADAD